MRLWLYEVIFESETRLGKLFDLVLIVAILGSVLAVMLESVTEYRREYGDLFRVADWGFTLLFTVEYALRLACVGRPLRYARSFFGVVDLLAVLPTYLSVLFPGVQYLTVIRLLRVLRVFRVLKLAAYMSETTVLAAALAASRRKIEVFLVTVLTLVVILGALMYLIEGEEHGFDNIPRSIYWAIVTLTTVGYGDISPRTNLGQFLAAAIMLLGYAILAVPTGIVTAEITRAGAEERASRERLPGDDRPATFCKHCGERL